MMPGSEERWRDRSGPTAGALGHLIERMTNDFTPQHDSQRFQPGFVPSASPPWTTAGQAPLTSQMTPLQSPHASLGSQMSPQMQSTHTNLGSQVSSMQPPHGNMGPQITSLQPPTTSAPGTMPLGSQIGGPGPRSYSVSQDPFDLGGGRSPLLRSSSDLGLRLSNFNDGTMDGYMDSSRDSIDSMLVGSHDSAFFPEVQRGPCVSSGTPPPPLPGDPQGLAPSPVSQTDFSFYTNEHERFMEGVSVNNITAKFSNFTATLGSWFSPFDPFRSNLNVGDTKSQSVSQSSSVGVVLETLGSDTPISSQCSVGNSGVQITGSQPTRTSKPSYSDVLSKNTAPDGRLNASCAGLNSRSSSSNSNSSNGNLTHPPQSPSPGPTASRPDHQNRNQSGKSKSKARNSNSLGASASSTNSNNINNNNNGNLTKSSEKADGHVSSRVGLDDFCLNEVSLSNGRISAYEHYDWGEKIESSSGYGLSSVYKASANSPTHQGKKSSLKGDVKKNTPEKTGSGVPADENVRGNDQLNNKISSTQQKQPPRRPSYINNNLNAANLASSATSPATLSGNNFSSGSATITPASSSSTSVNQSNNNNNNDCSRSDGNKKGSHLGKEDKKSFGIEEANSLNNAGSRTSRSKITANGRSDRIRDNQPKRSAKKRRTPSFFHSGFDVPDFIYHHDIPHVQDLAVAGWAVAVQWVGLVMQVVVWLGTLSADVVVMSTQLFLHMMTLLWAKLLEYWSLCKTCTRYYWTKLISTFKKTEKEEKKIPGREKKVPRGLECNIPLPTSGEEAMKRLLACKGKDPYSILGVTQECSDDDIKKYYRRQAFLVHPDKNKQPGAEEAFKIVAHAFEIIGEPEKRREYDARLAEEVQLEGAWGELASLLTRLQEKLDEAANTIRCTNCNKRHRRTKLPRPIYAARHCTECQIHHAAREGDIWAESTLLGLRWRYYACMEGAVYDISEWAACQSENLKHLQANTHSVQYRIVSGKKNPPSKNNTPEFPSDPDLEEFFNNLCKEKFGKSYASGNNQAGNQQMPDMRKRKGKKKK
ncbi:dnaJ homolog dnj-5 isoform X4 [Macrobrachium rosenbergii]